MRPEHLTVSLRPRGGMEAIDLGFALVRRHAREIWHAWLLLVVPVMLLLAVLEHALPDDMPVTGLLVWWAKPYYDAVVLLVLSRAVFGERLGPRHVLRELRGIAGRVLGALTLRRLSLSRSFLLPTHLLEGVRGTARQRRVQVLRENTTGTARTLTMACGWLEGAILMGLLALLLWLAPDLERDALFNGLAAESSSTPMMALTQLAWSLAITVIEPFYVAAGFTLYLNRRTWLEAWDIQLALAKVATRAPAAERR